MKAINIISFIVLVCYNVNAQYHAIDKYLGIWQGTMFIYSQGQIKDSIPVKFTAQKTKDPKSFIWRTEYLSPNTPIIKDYILREIDAKKGHYLIDEGEGLSLEAHLVIHKLYCVFEVKGNLLTANYELMGDKLIFEVSSCKKSSVTPQEVQNYSLSSIQRVELKKII